jgi:hypothetical protein
MASIIAWLANVNVSTGIIQEIYSIGGTIPENGILNDDGTKLIHILTDSLTSLGFQSPAQFLEENHYDIANNSWVSRGNKPGMYYTWVDSAWAVHTEVVAVETRQLRDQKLFLCDWTQTADSPLTNTKKAEWVTYRQALRDIMSNLPSDLDHPDNVSWPSPPS